jgi:DNA-binding MarR family transcriptional regulator
MTDPKPERGKPANRGGSRPATAQRNRVLERRSDAARRAAKSAAPNLVPLARSLGYHVRELSESWTAAMDVAARARGISLTQWRYLRELWEADRLSTGELTARVGREGPTTVVAVRSLEKARLVRVDKRSDDRRKTSICLTARGRRLAEVMSPLIRAVNESAVADLTANEVREFKRLLVKVQRKLDRQNPRRNSWSILRTDHLADEAQR